MKFLITGNIASGKTTFAELLASALKIKVYGIDGFRKQHSDGTLEGEWKSQENFIRQVEKEEHAIFEFVGVGGLTYHMQQALHYEKDQVLLVVLTTDNKICLERYKKRPPETHKTVFLNNIDYKIKRHSIAETLAVFKDFHKIVIPANADTFYGVKLVLDYLHNERNRSN